MLDKNDLLAIAELMDEKLRENNEALRQEMKANNEALRHEIMADFNTVIENKVSKEIRLIAEQHGDIVKKLEKLNRIDDLEDRVHTLELVVRKHTDDIKELKKAK